VIKDAMAHTSTQRAYPRDRENVSPSEGTVVFDLDGVVYLGSTPIQGAGDAIRILQDRGWQILFATNNSTKTPESVCAILKERAGVVVDPSSVITSGMAAAAYLDEAGIDSAFVVGAPELATAVVQAGIAVVDHVAAQAVVVGLDRSLSDATIEQASSAIREGALFVATNTDATYPTPDGEAPGAGATVAAIADATGATFVVCGKPHSPMARLVSRQVTSDCVWMIGDRLETDIAFAKQAGWRSVLALSGVTSGSADIPAGLTPDHIIDTIADLPRIVTDEHRQQGIMGP
jgi:4-nitrophenyl phosphatase